MKLTVFILAAFVGMICSAQFAAANWCAHYNLGGGSANCGFKTHQQCLAAIRGVGGSCGPSPHGHHHR